MSNAIVQTTLFDYAELDSETRVVVQQRTSEIRSLMRRAAQDIIDIGQKLIEVKGKLNQQSFEAWLQAEFDWSRQTAYRFIWTSERFGGCNNLLQLAPSALYLLSAPSTPDEARQEALVRAEQGEQVTHAAAKEIVERHKGADEATFYPQPVETEGPAPTPKDEKPVAQTPQWTKRQEELRQQLERGETVVVNLNQDHAVIEWAKALNLFVQIDRRTEWGNPFILGEDGDRAAVIRKYAHCYMPHKTKLNAQVHTLKGKCLACHCAPLSCHGDTLAALAEGRAAHAS